MERQGLNYRPVLGTAPLLPVEGFLDGVFIVQRAGKICTVGELLVCPKREEARWVADRMYPNPLLINQWVPIRFGLPFIT
jgi:hypothetical protein